MISILHRYMLREFARYFFVVQLIVVCIFVVVDYLGGMDRFLRSGISLLRAFTFVLLRIPFFFVQLVPVTIILAVIITFGLMNKDNEIIALKSSGVSIFYLIKPFIIVGFLMAASLFLISETIVPAATENANRIKYVEIKKENITTSKEKNIWIKGDGVISHIQFYNPVQKTAFGITSNFYDDNFTPTGRMDAEKGLYENGHWIFYNLLEQKKKNNNTEIKFYEKKEVPALITPDNLKSVVKKSEEMSTRELWAFVKRVESEGYDATVYRVDLHAKIAFPMVCVIMCMAGAGIAMRSSMKGRIPLSVACGVGVAFLYWVFYSFCLSLGHGETIPTWAAAWVPDLVFFFLAIYLLETADG